jgi:hypothetical protein
VEGACDRYSQRFQEHHLAGTLEGYAPSTKLYAIKS